MVLWKHCGDGLDSSRIMNQKGIRKVYVQLGALPIKKFYEKALWEGSVEKLCGKAIHRAFSVLLYFVWNCFPLP